MTTTTETAGPDLTRRVERLRESALKNIEQIRAYTDLVGTWLTGGEHFSPAHVQVILRNAGELAAVAAGLDELRQIDETLEGSRP